MNIGSGDADEFQLVFFRDGVIGGTFRGTYVTTTPNIV